MAIFRRRPSPVGLIIAALATGSIAIALSQLQGLEQVSDAISVPLPLLLVAFAASEVFVVHLHFRSESGGFSFAETPLILGALFAPPLHVWIAMTLGAVYAFGVVKKQPPIKLVFNVTNFSLQGAVALWIFHAFAGDPLSPRGWLAAAGAALVASAVSVAAFLVVVSVVERRIDLQGIKQTTLTAALTSVTNVALALIAASLIDYRPETLLLLIAPLLMLSMAYRSFLSEREQRERVQFMYESTSEIREMRHQAAIPEMLSNTAERLRAGRADLFLLPTGDSTQTATWFSANAGQTETTPLSSTMASIATGLAQGIVTSQLMSERQLDRLADLVGSKVESAMIGVMRVDDRVIGFMTVGNRLGNLATFTRGDVTLFSTVVDQLTLALENDQLEQAVSELKRVERELSAQANHDALTGLPNRTLLSTVLSDALAARLPVSVLYVDLDDFKLINDGLGHHAGDLVLIETGKRIREVVGPEDCVARLGGDEFAVVLINPANDMSVAKHILSLINRPITVAGHEARVGASIGVTRAGPGEELESLVARADAAMYSAKGAGKGSVVLDRPAEPTGFKVTTITKS